MNASSPSPSGPLSDGTPATITCVVTYTGGNGGKYDLQTATSTNVTGLTATLSAGSFTTSAGTLTYIITGTPSKQGKANFALSIGGQTATLTLDVNR